MKKDIFTSEMQALVNPVNCVGVMGAGLALQFKHRYPQNFIEYKNCCDQNLLKIGTCLTTFENGKYIINFPTKLHWKDPSEYRYIQLGLKALVRHIKHYNIASIAVPKLGAGLGGLQGSMVEQMIVHALSSLMNEENSPLKDFEMV